MVKKTLAPQQERSRESLRKLLKAAAEVLGQHGVEGATIPRIAQHAGLTPGAVYRRFKDKDALLETMVLGILERQDERTRLGLAPEGAAQIPLPIFAEQVIGAMVLSYRMNASLLRGMRAFVQSRIDTSFYKKVIKLEASTFAHAINLFMSHKKEIRHSDPRGAISLGIIMVSSMLHEWVVMPGDIGPFKQFLPKDDQQLKRELTRVFLSYLGVEQKKS